MTNISKTEALQMISESSKHAHSTLVSKIMIRLAEQLREDPAEWEIAGLLHDLDYDLVQDDPSQHGIKAAAILDGKVSEEILQAIMAHDHRTGQKATTLLNRALIFADSLAILIEDQSLDHDSDEEEIAEAISLEAKTKPWIPQIINRFCSETDLDSRALLKDILQET
jgi:putative nucleotidyltransferase with HDIG domain